MKNNLKNFKEHLKNFDLLFQLLKISTKNKTVKDYFKILNDQTSTIEPNNMNNLYSQTDPHKK